MNLDHILYSFADDALLVTDEALRVVACNDRALELYGYAREELLALTAPDLCAGGVVCEDGLAAVPRERGNVVIESVHRRKDGSTVPVESSVRRVEWAGECFYHHTVHDITARVLAEQALRDADLEKQTALDAAGMGVWRHDLASGSVHFDERAHAQYGLELSDATLDMVLERVHPDDLAALAAVVDASHDPSREGESYLLEFRVLPPGRRVRWLSVGVRVIFEGVGSGRHAAVSIGTSRDITARKAVEEAEAAGRARLAAALASMTDAVFISDADGRFVEFNDAFVSFHRFAGRAECLETLAEYPDILDVFFDDGRPAPLDEWAVPRALRGETAVDVEYGLRRKDTGEEWIGSYSFAPIRSEAGEIVGSVVVGRDITERKRMLRELQESEARFRSLFEHSPVAVFLAVPDGSIDAANPAACRMFGYSEEEFARLGRFGLLDAEDPRVARALEERALTGRQHGVELTAVRAGGERFPVEVDSIILPGDPPRSVVMLRDITERKLADEALAASEAEAREALARLSEAQALGHMGDWAWDISTGAVTWSPEVFRIYGVGPEFVTSFDAIVPMVHEDERAAHLRRVEAFAADPARASTMLDFRIVRPDGQPRSIHQTIIAERDAAGVAVRMYGLMQDVTEQRRAEDALVTSEARLRRLNLELEDRVEQRTEQLRLANEELESFSYTVSHDLRAPLRHISGFAGFLARHLGDGLDEEGRHLLDTITRSAREMGVLIDELLQFSRIGRAQLSIGRVDMSRCVQEVLVPLREEAAGRTVEVRVGDLPEVRGDVTLLRQVWANLLGNAFKYTRPRDTALVEVSCVEDAGELVFSVRDNGVGFDPEYGEQLFAVFHRLHAAPQFEGTGIGLATVRRIVERHGGRVWAESGGGEGATFSFSLPSESKGHA